MEPIRFPETELDFSKYSILIVDDNPTNLKVLFDYLEQYGFDILVARDGESAIQRASYTRPDIILLDVVMPETDGFTTCLQLKQEELTKDIPVIFMTALTNQDSKVQGFRVGGVDYITKPLQYEEVLARVTTHLRIRDLQQQLETQNVVLLEKNQRLQTEINERERIERQLKHLNAELKETNASKDKLFSIIAHDLRAPFSALLGLSETVIQFIDDYSKEEIRDNMIKIRTSSEAVYSLLENLLAWSRLQRGLMPFQPTRMPLFELAEENVALFKPQAEQKHLVLHHTISEQITVFADKSMLDTVIRNLISNAIKFTKTGGTIRLSANESGDSLEFAVSDTGIGIAKEMLSKLFCSDTQYTLPGTVGEHGTGLGLSLCKDLVEKHHGTIWVESVEGEGSTFRFTLPYSPERI